KRMIDRPVWRPRTFLPPVAAFLVARAIISFGALAAHVSPFDPKSFSRWDSDQYLSIARRGYDLVECARTGYLPTGWVGNAGGMPAYPALIHALSFLTRLSPLWTGVILSAVFEIGALLIAWKLMGERNFLALLTCALVPGMIYHHAIFPVSMCAFFVLLS